MRLVLAISVLALAACTRTIAAYPDQFGGVGLELRDEQDGPHVLRPIPGSSADAAGLRPGDRLLAVDGIPTSGRALAEVVERLRGPAGTRVAVVVERERERRSVDLMRTPVSRSQSDYRASQQ